MRDGQVKLVNFSFYDDIILNLLKNLEPCKVSVLVAHLLGEYDHICDIIYSFLIDRLITNNKIKLIKENKDRFFNSIVALNDEKEKIS